MAKKKKMEYHENAWFEMKPDVYAGPTCDGVQPRWDGFCEGDKDGDTTEILEFSAKTFAPGTKVVVSVPRCPDCDEPADMALDHTTGTMGKCACGFDWVEWTQDEYS